jgi:hypothetical protein
LIVILVILNLLQQVFEFAVHISCRGSTDGWIKINVRRGWVIIEMTCKQDLPPADVCYFLAHLSAMMRSSNRLLPAACSQLFFKATENSLLTRKGTVKGTGPSVQDGLK